MAEVSKSVGKIGEISTTVIIMHCRTDEWKMFINISNSTQDCFAAFLQTCTCEHSTSLQHMCVILYEKSKGQ